MARYYIHVRDGAEELLDPEGTEQHSLDALRKCVVAGARDLIKGDVDRGVIDMRCRIDAENRQGEVVYSLPFGHAVRIIPETGGQTPAPA